MLETLKLPSSQKPEASPNANPVTFDPNREAWPQLLANGPNNLIGLEWQDGAGHIKRISSYDTIQKNIWQGSKSKLPRPVWRSQVRGGPTISRSRRWKQETEEIDCWM